MTRHARSVAARILGHPVDRFQDLADYEKERCFDTVCNVLPADAWARIAAGGAVVR